MIANAQTGPAGPVPVRLYQGKDLAARLPALEKFVFRSRLVALSRHPRWLTVLARGMGHTPYVLEAADGERTCGFLPLAYVHSFLFGRFLVSLPYLNSNGVMAEDVPTARRLVDEAVGLADALGVRHLELRHEQELEHPALTARNKSKVHMRLPLPDFPGPLWESLPAKVRNQVRKGEKAGLEVVWGGPGLLGEFHAVFSRNMRDLGTPSYGRGFFRAVLEHFPADAELCVVRAAGRAVAAALLLHGQGITEVPSASSLREHNHTCANMLMYWHLLERAIQRGQAVFDFGRSTADSNTYRFKKQWGAAPEAATWQSYERTGRAGDVRPDNPRYQRLIGLWKRLPVSLTRLLGPAIVRGIP
jgi:FemAB-related protein (PEP-CTERM system-associated)